MNQSYPQYTAEILINLLAFKFCVKIFSLSCLQVSQQHGAKFNFLPKHIRLTRLKNFL